MSRGIDELKDIVDFNIAIINAVWEAAQDGKIGLTDLPEFFGAMKKLPAAINGLDEGVKDFLDLDSAEREELKKMIEKGVDLDSEFAEEIAEYLLKSSLYLGIAAKKVLDYFEPDEDEDEDEDEEEA